MKLPSKIEQPRANILERKAKDRDKEAARKVANSDRLVAHEDHIERMLTVRAGCDFEIGRELLAIQAEKDFPDSTFEAYIKRRFERTREWGYQLIDAYKIKGELPANVKNSLQNTGQARALKAAPVEKRAEVLSEVASTGPVTAKRIQAEIEKPKSKPKKQEPEEAEFVEVDEIGGAIPKAIIAEWNRAVELSKEIQTRLSYVRVALKKEDAILAEVRGYAEDASALYGNLKQIKPYAVCPICSGVKCKTCSHRGFISKSLYDVGISSKDKK